MGFTSAMAGLFRRGVQNGWQPGKLLEFWLDSGVWHKNNKMPATFR